jgi:SAM-dependent methyltransferase
MNHNTAQAQSTLLQFATARTRSVVKRILRRTVNNVLVNNIAIWLNVEDRVKRWPRQNGNFHPSAKKSLQENAGFWHRPDIDAALEATHADLRRVTQRSLLKQERKLRVLEIGCGPGLYLRDFDPEHFDVTGLDISPGMCRLACQTAPHARIIEGDFMTLPDRETFDLIYAIGMLQYIGRTRIEEFFERVAERLEPSGVFFMCYQHALGPWDLLFPDLTYIQYSPRLVTRLAVRHFIVLEHVQAFDERPIGLYDRRPYRSQIPGIDKTFLNSSRLVCRKDLA